VFSKNEQSMRNGVLVSAQGCLQSGVGMIVYFPGWCGEDAMCRQFSNKFHPCYLCVVCVVLISSPSPYFHPRHCHSICNNSPRQSCTVERECQPLKLAGALFFSVGEKMCESDSVTSFYPFKHFLSFCVSSLRSAYPT